MSPEVGQIWKTRDGMYVVQLAYIIGHGYEAMLPSGRKVFPGRFNSIYKMVEKHGLTYEAESWQEYYQSRTISECLDEIKKDEDKS